MTRALSSVESAADDIASEARSNVESGSEYDPSRRLVSTAKDEGHCIGDFGQHSVSMNQCTEEDDRTSTNQGRIDSKTRLKLESDFKSKSKATIAPKASRQPHWIPDESTGLYSGISFKFTEEEEDDDDAFTSRIAPASPIKEKSLLAKDA